MNHELSNMEAVLVALYRMGGDRSPQGTEDIAVEVDRLAPGRFRWRKYPQFISDELVRVSLRDAKKPRNGILLVGGDTKGWSLTVSGAKLAASLSATKGAPLRLRKDRDREHRVRVETDRLIATAAWSQYLAGKPSGRRDAEAVFRVGDYTKRQRREEMIERLRLLFLQDDRFEPFLTEMARIVRQAET